MLLPVRRVLGPAMCRERYCHNMRVPTCVCQRVEPGAIPNQVSIAEHAPRRFNDCAPVRVTVSQRAVTPQTADLYLATDTVSLADLMVARDLVPYHRYLQNLHVLTVAHYPCGSVRSYHL